MVAKPAMVEATGVKKKGKKSLAHMEIHPKLGGGHTVRHVYSGYDHEPKEYHFGEAEGHRATAHIVRHAGLAPVKAEGSEHENEEDIAEQPSKHSHGGRRGTEKSYYKNSEDMEDGAEG